MLDTFVAHFISFLTANTGGPGKWAVFEGMQDLMLTSKERDTVTMSVALHAVSTAYIGITSRDRDITAQALRMYAFAVSAQHRAIARREVPRMSTICTTVLLSLFESVCPTGEGVYARHLSAARRMLGLARGEVEGSVLKRQVGVHVLYQTVCSFPFPVFPHLCMSGEDADWKRSCLLWSSVLRLRTVKRGTWKVHGRTCACSN